ncbi:molybdate transport system substrate-binding protein [Poseidonocella pacifica]|uniref:Molybdate-binding protein ModA n=1 Tax=Poseidonocella pacifica TaxID=871651 RepID=A0A1I0XZ89_9RHOB|nr:molybdate ABC transporter substrate-binding protein [Poseidonocella pacifica]SFB05680.1 molybdate transport system substrate-binding protein [Poseidonocella pacifica]
MLRPCFILLALCVASGAWADRITVFAAASLKTALDDAARDFEAATDHTLALNYAGSSVLARQIAFGAPADVFISANPDWMDLLESEGRIVPQSRRDLLRNRLVIVGAKGTLADTPETLLSAGRIAMALVDSVPAGVYGKAALLSLGLWEGVAPRVVQSDNVRTALALVARGEVHHGIVYATDAQAEPGIAVLYDFPQDSHPEIIYPAALIAGHGPAAVEFLEFLDGAEARETFTDYGFLLPEAG